MALDHYISQIYLRQFLSPDFGKKCLCYAIRKSDGVSFTPQTRDVCRIEEGNTNLYLQDPRAIEEFLATIEPRITAAIDAFGHGSNTKEHIKIIASLAAYIGTCSPAAMRIQSEQLRQSLEATTLCLDKQNILPQPPRSLGPRSMSELLLDGSVRIKVDPKYPQSIGISQIQKLTDSFSTSSIKILHIPRDKPNGQHQFLTSDFPLAIQETHDRDIINRIMPLSPCLAAVWHPGHAPSPTTNVIHRTIEQDEIRAINRAIVRSAEDVVFYQQAAPWIESFIQKNRHYRVVPRCRRVETPRGYLLSTRLSLTKAY